MLKTTLATLLCLAVLVGLAGMQNADEPPTELPPGHPPMQRQMPPGHPPMQPPTTQAAPEPDPADVESIDAIVNAYYDSVSGPKGEARDWDRFRSLFIADARLVTARAAQGRATAIKITPDQFVRANQRYFEQGGYFEREIFRKVDQYGRIAHVLSTYESRRDDAAPKPYSRGVNSIQLLFDGEQWRIVTIMWDYERPGETPIPARYLPRPGGGG
jgi:hypothetical protein